MARKSTLLPNNIDGLWRRYYGSRQYHHYDRHQLCAAWQKQVADCGRTTTTGNGAYSPLRPDSGCYQPVCGKCRRFNEKRSRMTQTGSQT